MQELGIRLVSRALGVKDGLGDQSGQGMVEYALILGLISVVCIVALGLISGDVQGIFTTITNTLGTV